MRSSHSLATERRGMRLTRLDDYQSWLVEVNGRRLAIDPWLTNELSLPPGHWLFGRRRARVPTAKERIADIDALVLTGPFSDHLDPETLSVLPRTVPTFANAPAARVLVRLGFTRVTTMHDGHIAKPFDDDVTLEAVRPGFPYRHNSLGYLLTNGHARLYLETHTVDLARQAARLKNVDVAVLPVQGVWLFGIPFVMSPERALEVTRALTPRVVVPTGNDPHKAHGLMSKAMLSTRGTLEDFSTLLEHSGLPTTFSNLAPGESVAAA